MTATDWPSLTPQIALAERLFGSRGVKLLGTWLDEQIGRITDPAFARLFTDHINLPGIATGDYNHRLVRTPQGRLLGGIRFYGHDLARPFIEVVAHDFTDLTTLRHCVAAEWAAFAPLHLRILTAAGSMLPQDAHVDMSIHSARCAKMAPPDGRVTLARFGNGDEAVAMVTDRYSELAEAEPALARNISAAKADDLLRWHDEGQVTAIRAEVDGADKAVGLLAVAPGAVEWIEGDEVNEEVVMTSYSGHGFAASAQKQWAARADPDRDRLLVGTIDSLNGASRRSAIRAGRPALLDYAFLPVSERR